MARKLKTYVTSLGFFEEAVAAPSMKAALRAWGSSQDLFQKGFAQESDDPAIVAATMKHPGMVLKRPVGSKGSFKQNAELPTSLPVEKTDQKSSKAAKGKTPKKQATKKQDTKEALKAAEAYEREEKRQEQERQKKQAMLAKVEERRERAISKATAELESAEAQYDQRMEALKTQRATIDEKIEAEQTKWHGEKKLFEAAIDKAKRL